MQRRTLWLIVGILGISAIAALVCIGALMALMPILLGEKYQEINTLQIAAIIGTGLVLGSPLVLQAWAGWRERPSHPFKPAQTWWLWLALIPTLIFFILLGAAIDYFSLAPDALLPPIHVLTMTISPLLILGLAGWGLRGTGGTRREVTTAMAGGGLLGLGASAALELLAVLVAAVAAAVVVAVAIPDGPEQINTLMNTLMDRDRLAGLLNDPALLLSPMVIVSTAAGFIILAPLVEEVSKTLAGGVVGRWIRPHPTRAFMWGVAAGAGFTLAENLLNGAMSGTEGWAIVAVTRLGSTTMHCFTSGLVGWGWGQLWTARRPLHLIGAYAAAVTIHGLWNAAAVGMLFLSLGMLAHPQDWVWVLFAATGVLTFLGMLGLMAVALTILLPLIARRLATQTEAIQDTTAPAIAPHPVPLGTSTP